MKIILSCLFLLAITTAQAGDIRGTIINKSRLTPKHIVVYLEGDIADSNKTQAFVIEQKNRKFRPKFLVVPAGRSIIFRNNEAKDINHNVFSRSPNGNMDLGLMGPGSQESRVFPKQGRVRVLCSVHRHMRMEVYVTPNAYFAEVKNNRYVIKNVPPGTYTIKAWVSNGRIRSAASTITVTSGKMAVWDVELRRRGRRRSR